MEHQFDVALIQAIESHRRPLLKQLNKLVFQTKPRWYEIFLAIFLLLSNLEYVHKGALDYYHCQKQTVC